MLWQEASDVNGTPSQPRLTVKAFDQPFFNRILLNTHAMDEAAPEKPTSTQARMWANLKVRLHLH